MNGVVAAREQSAVAGREGVRMERKCGTEGKERVGDGVMFQFLLTSLLHADGI